VSPRFSFGDLGGTADGRVVCEWPPFRAKSGTDKPVLSEAKYAVSTFEDNDSPPFILSN
jgi:hypothetical protein